MLIIF